MNHPLPIALIFLVACSAGCKDPPPVKKDPPPAAVPVVDSAAPPSPSASAAPADTIPSLVAEKFAPAGTDPSAVFPVEGGLAVTEKNRVGLVTGEAITWVGNVPKETPGLGESIITSVVGRAPDLVAAVYTSSQGRAPQPTYQLLTGKKEAITAAPGGGWGNVRGPARVGETVFVATEDNASGTLITPIHGPRLVRHLITSAEAGCKPDELVGFGPQPALVPAAFESTPAGSMISVGTLCSKRGEAAEVWDPDGKTRIVDLGQWWKRWSFRTWLLKGEGDELWAARDGWNDVVLRYKDGAFSPLPPLERRIVAAFVSPRGQLHVSDGKTVYRFDGAAWTPAFALPAEAGGASVVMDEKDTLWASSGSRVYRLHPGPAVAKPGECATPFVYLYAASYKNGKDYTYPTTRKALAGFPEASSLGFVEFGATYDRGVGVTVKSRAQGKALIAHLATAMKDEDPRFYCHAPNQDVRQIPLDAKP
jgi:hypothetical protein